MVKMEIRYRFAPASAEEKIVFGSKRPGYDSRDVPDRAVREWVKFMKDQGIQRICCLLHPDQLEFYSCDLLAEYKEIFGASNVCHAPIPDYHLIDPAVLSEVVLPFLKESAEQNRPVLVHCSGGSGRTGHVLAAWLTRERGMDLQQGLTSTYEQYRNPREAVFAGNAAEEDLIKLLDPDLDD